MTIKWSDGKLPGVAAAILACSIFVDWNSIERALLRPLPSPLDDYLPSLYFVATIKPKRLGVFVSQ